MKTLIHKFCNRISSTLERKGLSAKTVSVKYKTASFQNHSRSKTHTQSLKKAEDIYEIGCELIDEIVLTNLSA